MSVITTKQFWDCGCSKDYVRAHYEKWCDKCWNTKEDMPDAHVEEVPLSDLISARRELETELMIICDEIRRREALVALKST